MTLESLQEGQVFLVDKPLDWTSFDVVNKMRWGIRQTFGVKKIKVGHAGTLDPKATGLLVICVGKATKTIDRIQGESKTYTGIIKLGATTPCYDTEQAEDAHFETAHITPELIHQTALQFVGEIDQLPPIHSAIRQDGKRLYEMARQGQAVEAKSRKVSIDRFNITQIDGVMVHFEVDCGKGTYIRSLAHDFGKALNSGGYLVALRRERIGDYDLRVPNPHILAVDYFEKFNIS